MRMCNTCSLLCQPGGDFMVISSIVVFIQRPLPPQCPQKLHDTDLGRPKDVVYWN